MPVRKNAVKQVRHVVVRLSVDVDGSHQNASLSSLTENAAHRLFRHKVTPSALGCQAEMARAAAAPNKRATRSPRRRDSNRTVRTAPQRRLNGFARHASMSSAFTLRSCVSSCASLRRSCSKRYARRAGVCALAACVSRVSSIASSRRPDLSLSRPHESGQFSSVILVG